MNSRKGFVGCCLLVMVLLSVQTASASTFSLFEWVFNVDGTISDSYFSDPLPSGLSGNLAADGTPGSITMTMTGGGARYFGAMFDYEMDEILNGFSNEYGVASGSPVAGQSWEIDEPGWVFGDIYTNLGNSALDNTNAVQTGTPDDVSIAFGWNVVLQSWQTALITLNLSHTAPTSGFYLGHFDPDSNASLYFSSSLRITGTQPPTGAPEPGTAALLLVGLGVTGAISRAKRKKSAASSVVG